MKRVSVILVGVIVIMSGEAYKKDDPRAEVYILDAGHFALDLKPREIIRLTQDFMTTKMQGRSGPDGR